MIRKKFTMQKSLRKYFYINFGGQKKKFEFWIFFLIFGT